MASLTPAPSRVDEDPAAPLLRPGSGHDAQVSAPDPTSERAPLEGRGLAIIAGAMAARDLSPRLASVAALVLSLLIAFLTWFYYHLNVSPPVAAGYGLYVGAACALAALACSVWALAAALLGARTAR